jgi:3-hydroxyisobutyrate dehydrogenase-like beta-hydroxyacid dehydrogenase
VTAVDAQPPPRIAVFGLGEAGGSIATDLAGRGALVHGYDPAAHQSTPPGVTRHGDPITAVHTADLVLAVTAAVDAEQAVTQALDAIPAAAVYADLSTAAPALKERLADHARRRRLAFVDVALMSTVPGNGMATPQLVSGSGVERYLEVLGPLGLGAEAVGGRAGAAATRKLLRSVVTKGLAAILIEALRAGGAAGLRNWLWEHLVAELEALDGRFVRRLVEATGPHAERRQHEMEAATRMLIDLGVEPRMTAATVASLRAARTTPPPPLPDAP